MKNWRLLYCVWLLILLAWVPSSGAALRLVVGNSTVPSGTNRIQIPILISGGDLLTDMVGVIQLGDGGPLVGGTPGPVLQAITYGGSIWSGAAGGFDTNATIALPAQLYDPNVILRVSGQKVPGQGVLFTLIVDTAGVAPGFYELRLGQVRGFSTSFQNGGVDVPATIVNGWIAVGTTFPTNLPRVSVAPLAGGRARLSWNSEDGRRYRVQWKPAADAAWNDVVTEVSGTGSDVGWVDEGPGKSRFYRVRIAK